MTFFSLTTILDAIVKTVYAEKNSVMFDIVSTNQRKEIVKDI